MRTSVKNIIKNKDPEKKSYSIEVIKMDSGIESDRFRIPVIHAGDGRPERGMVNTSIKATHQGSKYMQPSFSVMGKSYQVSHKK